MYLILWNVDICLVIDKRMYAEKTRTGWMEEVAVSNLLLCIPPCRHVGQIQKNEIIAIVAIKISTKHH